MRGNKRNLLIVLIVILVILVGVSIYFLYIQPNGIFHRKQEENEYVELTKDLDNRNGIYLNYVIPEEFTRVSSACTVTKLEYYMVVINKKWYSYRSSCMGTYQTGEGTVEDLDIKYNSERDEFSFTYNGKRFVKNKNLLSIAPEETFIDSKQNVSLEGYKLLAQETMFENHYYIFENYILDVGGVMRFGKESADEPYTLAIMAFKEREESNIYRYESYNLDDFPQFNSFNKKIAIRELYQVNGRTNYTLKLYEFGKGITYDLNNHFPITVNGVQLSSDDHYVYLDTNVNRHYYVMLVSTNPKFCVEGSESNNIAYYEFKVEFDYNNYSFKTPTFVRAWYEKEGCKHVDKVMEG